MFKNTWNHDGLQIIGVGNTYKNVLKTLIIQGVLVPARVPFMGRIELFQNYFAQSTGAVECRITPNECPGYDTKQSDGEVPAVLELWGMRSTPSLELLPGLLWPSVVAPDRALSMG